jgi:type I restriction enzyme R subunit
LNIRRAQNEDTLAFYDAQNESAVSEMGTGVLADIARDLVCALRDVTTDWVSCDALHAKLCSTIKRLLAKHGYRRTLRPPVRSL